jgi:hypothetical protein
MIFHHSVEKLVLHHCRNQDFWVGGPKNIFLSQMNLIVAKFIRKLFFYYNDFLQANCTDKQ